MSLRTLLPAGGGLAALAASVAVTIGAADISTADVWASVVEMSAAARAR